MRQGIVAVNLQRFLPVSQRLCIAAFAMERDRLMNQLDEMRRLENGNGAGIVVQHIKVAVAVMVDGDRDLEQAAHSADTTEGAQQIAFLIVLIDQAGNTVHNGDDAVVLHGDVRQRGIDRQLIFVLQRKTVLLRLVGVVAYGIQLADLRGILIGKDAVNHVVRTDKEVGIAGRFLLDRTLHLGLGAEHADQRTGKREAHIIRAQIAAEVVRLVNGNQVCALEHIDVSGVGNEQLLHVKGKVVFQQCRIRLDVFLAVGTIRIDGSQAKIAGVSDPDGQVIAHIHAAGLGELLPAGLLDLAQYHAFAVHHQDAVVLRICDVEQIIRADKDIFRMIHEAVIIQVFEGGVYLIGCGDRDVVLVLVCHEGVHAHSRKSRGGEQHQSQQECAKTFHHLPHLLRT